MQLVGDTITIIAAFSLKLDLGRIKVELRSSWKTFHLSVDGDQKKG